MTYRTVTAPEVALPPAVDPAPAVVTEDDVLELAAEIIEEEGWARGVLHATDGSFCALGAINEAAGRLAKRNVVRAEPPFTHSWRIHWWHEFDRLQIRATHKLANYLPKDPYLSNGARKVWRWNDKPTMFKGRRKKKVVAALRSAAKS